MKRPDDIERSSNLHARVGKETYRARDGNGMVVKALWRHVLVHFFYMCDVELAK